MEQLPLVFIAAYSDGLSPMGTVPADRIFAVLFPRNVWFVSRKSGLEPGSVLLLHESGAGVRGYATVEDVGPLISGDKELLSNLGVFHVKYRLRLTDAHTFAKAVQLRPLIQELEFVADKKHWGSAIRITPRRIPRRDFETILGHVES